MSVYITYHSSETSKNSSNMSSSLVFSFLLFLFSSPLTLLPVLSCHIKDSNALLSLKRSFNSPPRLSTWNASTDCCGWFGIICDATNGRVSFLLVQFTEASGPISPSIGQLSKLETLIISHNTQITGSIPHTIGKLKQLSLLQIDQNSLLAGHVPKSICRLTKLTQIRLGQNQLTGHIPECLGKNLTYIDMSFNRLSGKIPGSFLSHRFTDAPVTPNLCNNSMTGIVPSMLGDVPFDSIDLSANKLSDALALFGKKKKISSMYLANNELDFDLSNVRFPLSLEVVTLDHNRLSGSIPKQITELKRLRQLDLSYNRLCGLIPTGGFMSSEMVMVESFLHNKCLCGAPLKPCR